MAIHFSAKKEKVPYWPRTGVTPVGLDSHPPLNTPESGADTFINKATQGQMSSVRDYLVSSDPKYLEQVPGYKRSTEEYETPRAEKPFFEEPPVIDHLYSLNGDAPGHRGHSLKNWARQWASKQPKQVPKEVTPLVKSPVEPQNRTVKGPSVNPNYIPEPSGSSNRLRPQEGLAEFMGDSATSPTTVAFAPHDAWNEPVTFTTTNVTHHCEKCLPVCEHCGTRDLARNIDPIWNRHTKPSLLRECEARRMNRGQLPMLDVVKKNPESGSFWGR